ncbi:MAG TPA: hypothetical protein DEQ02_02650 [Ruminococcaceae bacterium]|nr:hypothetical protein [Oscillospiraceae bacterium]
MDHNSQKEQYENLPPNQYPHGIYQPPFRPSEAPGKGLASASMVMGILALCLLCFDLVSMACGIIAVILCGFAKSKGNRTSAATAGLICGLIAFAVSLAMYVLHWDPGIIGF